MNKFFGILLYILGVFLSVYCLFYGVYWMLIGGFIDIIETIKSNPINRPKFAFGLVKMMLSPFFLLFAMLVAKLIAHIANIFYEK